MSGEAVIKKFERAYERDIAKAEALEARMTKGLAAALKKEQNKVAREFMDYRKENRTDDDLRKLRDVINAGTGMNEDNWGDEVTGEEEITKRLQNDDEEYF